MNHTGKSVIWRSSAAACAAVALVATAGPAQAGQDKVRKNFHGALRDLQPTTVEPLDGASAKMRMVSRTGATTFDLRVKGIDRTAAGHKFGAHLHTGPCVAGDGAAAGPHYNQSALNLVVPPVVNDTTEVWLDVVVTSNGKGDAVAHVPFVPAAGQRSVVIHHDPTDVHGTAGPRLACLPVEW